MREIKFRGRGLEGNWYYGHYYHEYGAMPHPIKTDKSLPDEPGHHWIVFPSFADWGMPRQMQQAEIDIETLGEYTGLKDKNGKEIYEGDILEGITGNFPVIWDDNTVSFKATKKHTEISISRWGYREVIGNIYSNPELLE